MKTYERILVPLDFSAASREAARHAIGMARCMDAEIQFLHVVDDRQIAMVPGNLVPLTATRDPALTESTLKRVDEYVRDLDTTGIKTSVRVRLGAPFDEILAHAGEWNASLIVMGTHGRTGLSRAVLGSQAEMVVRRSRVPVLVVHATGDQEAKTEA